MDDCQLLEEYALRGSETAFTQLVERHLGLVHAVALRQVQDPALAADVAQVVFLLLAKKAKSLRHEVVLAGWLFRTTRFAAARARRAEFRRQRRDHEAYTMQKLNADSPDWDRLAPELDEALATLQASDRNVLLLRFTEGRNHREVGTALGLTEEAAKKRANRALDRLRVALLGQGVTLSAALIVAFFAEHLTAAPPAGLANAICREITSGAANNGAAATLARGVARSWRRVQLLIAGAILLPIALLLTVVVAPRRSSSPNSPARLQTSPSPLGLTPKTIGNRTSIAEETFRLKVVAAHSGDPIVGAEVPVNYVTNGKWSSRDDLVTDAFGFCEVPLPQGRLQRLDVGVHANGWQNRRFSWRSDWQYPRPPSYELMLERAETIGGRVVDPLQHAIAGAQVWLSCGGGDTAWSEPAEDRERPGSPHRISLGITDAQGRWTCGTFATSTENFSIEFEHPNFEPGRLQISPSVEGAARGELLAQLRARRATTVLARGFVASGLVIDATGEPISNARIATSWNEPGIRTDAAGQFSVRSLPRGETAFVATAEGYAPKTFSAHAGGSPVRIELEPGGLLRAQILTPTGEGIPGAFISLAPNDTLEEQIGFGMIGWDDETDADGWVVWRSAPRNQTLAFSVEASGYRHPEPVRLRTDGSEQTVLMQPTVLLSGTVVDAISGDPVPRFKAIPGTDINSRSGLAYGTNGHYQLAFSERLEVRLEADGYGIEIGRPKMGPAGQLRCDFRLKRESGIHGVVLSPDGSPASDTEVALATLEHGLQLGRGKFVRDDVGSIFTRTDAAGQFAFPVARVPHTVAAISSSGFGRTRVRAGQRVEIRLEPFGEVAGTVKINGQLAAGQAVNLMSSLQLAHLMEPSGIFASAVWLDAASFQGVTDRDGRFRFANVPIGDVHVGLDRPAAWPPLAETRCAQVNAGQTAFVTIGDPDARGREVRGRIVPSELSLTTNWAHQFVVHSLYKNTLVPKPPEELSDDDRGFWLADWHQSDAGRTAARLLANHTVEFAADGSFSVHGVLPGEYQLNLVALPRQRMTQTSWDTRSSEWSGKVRTQVLIPEADSVSTNNNVDLGELEMTIQRLPPK